MTTTNNTLQKALFFLEQEQYDQAIAILDSEIDHADSILYLGLAYLLKGEEEKAQEIWMAALFDNPLFDSQKLGQVLLEKLDYFLDQIDKNVQQIVKVYTLLLDLDETLIDGDIAHKVSSLVVQLKKEALAHVLARKLSEAQELYEKILVFQPEDDEVLYQLGMVYYELEDYNLAKTYIEMALAFKSDSGLYYDGLGMILEKVGEINLAIRAYSLAIELDSKNPNSYIKLANLLKRFDLVQEAKSVYEQASAQELENFALYMNYANLLMEDENYEKAVDLYKKSSSLQPTFADIYHNLALAYEKLDQPMMAVLNQGRNAYHEGRIEEAFEKFEEYRLSELADLDFYNELGNYYQAQVKHAELIPIIKEALQLHPESIRQRVYLIDAYKKTNQSDLAIIAVDESLNFFLNQEEKQIVFDILQVGIVPIIYDSEDELNDFREKYLNNLQVLEDKLTKIVNVEKSYLLFSLRNQHNYNLHFNSRNDLCVQISYCKVTHFVLSQLYPQYTKKLVLNIKNKPKIRIGYICYRPHSLGQLFVNWIKLHNHDLFEIYFYDLSTNIYQNTEKFIIYADHYVHISEGFEAIAEKVLDDKLNILVFLDIGIYPLFTLISVLRLSPIQCNTWGHPITSGSPNIDYFLGSNAMEPDNAQEHYSERLIRLPNLGISFSAPELPKILKTRSELALNDEDILLISCQMTPKYLPQHDYLFCEIAQKIPNGKILFNDSEGGEEINKHFKNRLKRKFDEYHLDFDRICQFRPRVKKDDYLNLLYVADVFLDTIGWSGGLTSMDAIVCNLPIVTLPGEFMRGRQSYGMLKIIGVTETIAKDEKDYIDIAVRLSLDAEWRNQIKEKLQANSYKLFDDTSCIKALEDFYQQAIKEKLSTQNDIESEQTI